MATPNFSAAYLVNFALGYAARGWRVVPLHTPLDGACSCGDRECTHIGKHPRVRNWQRVGTCDSDLIRNWWRLWPTANIGILTGRTTSLLVLDVDPGGAATIAANGDIGDTATVITGSGLHHYLKHPGIDISNAVRLLPGLDLRSDGGLVVAPPSLHANGNRYEWRDRFAVCPIIPAPAWLLSAYASSQTPLTPAPAGGPTLSPAQGGASQYALSALRGEIAKLERALAGTRNSQLNRAAFALGTLVGAGELDELFVIDQLTTAGLAVQLHPVEVQRTIRSGLRAGILKPRTVAPPAKPKHAQ